MDTQQERLSHLDHALSNGENICSSEGMLCSFPTSLKKPFMINGAGLIVCRQGNFTFSLNMKVFSAQAGETVFIPEDSLFQVLSESEDLQLFIFIYQIEPIRDIIGNSVATMYLYMQLRTEPCYVWNTGDEEEVLKYMSLLDNTLHLDNNTFNDNEQRLLLLGLTYRICSIYNRKLMNLKTTVGHKHEFFIRLGNITCIEQINSEHFFIGTDKRIYLVKLENGNLKELSCGKLEMMDMIQRL